jgi:hypothetical protein
MSLPSESLDEVNRDMEANPFEAVLGSVKRDK